MTPPPDDSAKVTVDLAEAIESVRDFLDTLGSKLSKASSAIQELDGIKATIYKMSTQLDQVFTGDHSLIMRVVLLERKTDQDIARIRGKYALLTAGLSGAFGVTGALLAIWLKS